MTRSDGTQTYLTQYFADMANWHADDAARATDRCGLSTAAFLEAMAEHVRELRADDLRLVALGRLTGFSDELGFSPGPRVSAALADVGHFIDGSPEPFLEYLVHAALDDQLDENPHATAVLVESVEARFDPAR